MNCKKCGLGLSEEHIVQKSIGDGTTVYRCPACHEHTSTEDNTHKSSRDDPWNFG